MNSCDYCVYASEVAALIGANPYKSPDETLLAIWKRANFSQYEACRRAACTPFQRSKEERAHEDIYSIDKRRAKDATRRLIRASATPVSLLTCVKRVVEQDVLVQSMPPIVKKAKVEAAVRLCEAATEAVIERAMANIPSHAPKATIATILRTQPAMEATRSLRPHLSTLDAAALVNTVAHETKVLACDLPPVPTIAETIAVAVANEDAAPKAKEGLASVVGCTETMEAVTSKINTGIGTRLEQRSLDRFERKTQRPVMQRNARGYCKSVRHEGIHTKIYGRIDGVMEGGVVIEHKQRQNQLFRQVVQREQIQVYVYMFLTRCRSGKLVETYRDKQAAHNIPFDDDVWERYLDRIKTQVQRLHTLVCSEDDRERVRLMRTKYK